MPSIAQSTRISNTSSMNLVVAGGIIVLVIGLFFVPEFVVHEEPAVQDLQQVADLDVTEASESEAGGSDAGELIVAPSARASLGPISDSIVLVGEDDEAPSQDIIVVGGEEEASPLEDLSPLERVSILLDADEPALEELVEDEVSENGELAEGEEAEVTEDDDAVFNYTEEQLIDELVTNSELQYDYIVPEEPLKWEMVRTPEGIRTLKKTRRTVRKLGNKMDKDFNLSKLALKEYEKVVTAAMNSSKKHDVVEVKKKLEKLDLTVTAAFERENAPPSERLQWADLHIGPYLQSRFAHEKKLKFKTTLEPELRISTLKMRHLYSKHGVFDESKRTGLKMVGRVKGNHIKTIEAYRNGKRIKRVALDKRPDGQGFRKFTFKQMKEIKGSVYTFKVTDVKDRVYERSYSFYPKVRAFKWNGHTDGNFVIPFQEDDPRLDQFFLLGYGRKENPVKQQPKPKPKPAFVRTGLATF